LPDLATKVVLRAESWRAERGARVDMTVFAGAG